jgi:hypothetical protein
MTRMQRAALGVCVFGVLWVGSPASEAARSAPALKDRKGLTKEVRDALRKRAAALREQLQGGFERVKVGKDSVADFLQAVREWYEAEVALADTRDAERAVLQNVSRWLAVGEEQMAVLHQARLQPYDAVLQWRAALEKLRLELEKRQGGK